MNVSATNECTGSSPRRLRRQMVAAVVSASLLLVGALAIRGGRCAASGDDLLQLAVAGSRGLAASIHSGRGKVVIDGWALGEDDRAHRNRRTYDVVFSGPKFRACVQREVLQNDRREGNDADKMLMPPGTVMRYTVVFDGQSVLVDYPDEKQSNLRKAIICTM